MPAEPTPDTRQLHEQLVESLQAKGVIRSRSVEAAFRMVQRHLFVPHVDPETAYADTVIPVKFNDDQHPISSSSQPTMMAIMLEQLGLEPGMRVLEIGAGTGYNAALMGHIIGEDGLVVTVDIDADLVDNAAVHLQAAQATNVQAIHTDGALGVLEYAPYDRIILTVAAWDITKAWMAQLAPGGRMVMPLMLTGGAQVSAAFERDGDALISHNVSSCRFMELRGRAAAPETTNFIDLTNGLTIQHLNNASVDPKQVMRLLKYKPRVIRSGLDMRPNEVQQFLQWVGIYGTQGLTLIARGKLLGKKAIPALFGDQDNYEATSGRLHPAGMALWGWQPSTVSNQQHMYEIVAYAYGPDGENTAQPMLDDLHTWHQAGRPSLNGLQIRVVPKDQAWPLQVDDLVLEKPSVNLIMHFNM